MVTRCVLPPYDVRYVTMCCTVPQAVGEESQQHGLQVAGAAVYSKVGQEGA